MFLGMNALEHSPSLHLWWWALAGDYFGPLARSNHPSFPETLNISQPYPRFKLRDGINGVHRRVLSLQISPGLEVPQAITRSISSSAMANDTGFASSSSRNLLRFTPLRLRRSTSSESLCSSDQSLLPKEKSRHVYYGK